MMAITLSYCKKVEYPIAKPDLNAFNKYWFDGKAEISSFALKQSRYGAMHDGTQIMTFVTEDFSKKRHVKIDNPQFHAKDLVKVLKLNTNREFITGIYKYNLMSSVYTPLDGNESPKSLKLIATAQDWCGQSMLQANWKGNRYEIQQFSYFDDEGDSKLNLSNASLEDELWTIIRTAPHTLKSGEFNLIPGAFYMRLNHIAPKAYKVEGLLKKMKDTFVYSIHYPELDRKLEIEFEMKAPYKIIGWKESNSATDITSGELLNTIKLDYWNHHQPVDKVLRDQLDLPH